MSDSLLLGAVADDYTGASDLASMLTEQGVRTVQIVGIQPDAFVQGLRGEYQAAVIALKSREAPATVARQLSVRAAEQLKSLGARQIQFKYCSTFDSTREGNIGPVTEALLESLGADFTVAVPSLPVNGRTQYGGYLYVNGVLLSETHMRHHPVTPMTDANLVRHLQQQTTKKVGLIPYSVVNLGAGSIQADIARLKESGVAIALVDVLDDRHLESVAEAVADLPLITGASGLGMKLPQIWRKRGLLSISSQQESFGAGIPKAILILAGSCSAATLQQIEIYRSAGFPAYQVNVPALLEGQAERELERLREHVVGALKGNRHVLVYSSAPAGEREQQLQAVQDRGLTLKDVQTRIQQTMARLAQVAVEVSGASGLIVAGGETSASVTDALGIQGFEIHGAVDPGVPCLREVGSRALTMVLKSGNFGAPDFFLKAIRFLTDADQT